MSTFDGIIDEFKDIRGSRDVNGSIEDIKKTDDTPVDFFRDSGKHEPPLACFLSHVHCDHLAGLANRQNSPPIYCSATTREILLRLAPASSRINYAQGIIESRPRPTYRALERALKPLPLDTPSIIQLRLDYCIQVTLLDANHCPGAVMFLIEARGRAVLYTGDIRSEPWFVNALARNPCMVEYSAGIKTLDKIYLDTSFIQDVPFQTKAEGIAELLRKVARYPKETIFHFNAWTWGYEEVWIALSKALNTRVHVDEYKMSIYNSLTAKWDPGEKLSSSVPECPRAAADLAKRRELYSPSVHLCPAIATLTDHMCGNRRQQGCLTTEVHPANTNDDPDWSRDRDVRIHSCDKGNRCSVVEDGPVVRIQPIIAHLKDGDELEEQAMSDLDHQDGTTPHVSRASGHHTELPDQLPRTIRFPYSRHSSYRELCHLVDMLKPRDVWPCTVQEERWYLGEISIELLFGKYCSGDRTAFAFDLYLADWAATNAHAEVAKELPGDLPDEEFMGDSDSQTLPGRSSPERRLTSSPLSCPQIEPDPRVGMDMYEPAESGFVLLEWDAQDSQQSVLSVQSTQLSGDVSLERRDAYAAMRRNLRGGEWGAISLLSTSNHHTVPELVSGGCNDDERASRPSGQPTVPSNRKSSTCTADDDRPRRARS